MVVTGLGDMLGFPKSLLVNFVVRHVKKMVPPWSLPQAVTFREALRQGAAHPLKPVPITHDDLAYLQYTGGTTGVAKGAMLTHGNIIANLQQAHAWISPYVKEGEELIVTALPLYHIFADRELPDLLQDRCQQSADHQPRDIPASWPRWASIRSR
jgi:long-chain acyl-CoA synthetase